MSDSFSPSQSLVNSSENNTILPENHGSIYQINLWKKLLFSSVLLFSFSCLFNTRNLPISLNLNLATAIIFNIKNREYSRKISQDILKQNPDTVESNYSIQQNQVNALERKYKHLACTTNNYQLELQQELESLKEELSQIQPERYINKSHLNILTNGIREVKRKQKQLELADIKRVDHSVGEIQQHIAELSELIVTLPKSRETRNREQNFTEKVDNIAIFIDGSNLYYTLKNLQLEIDFRKFLAILKGDAKTYQAYFYTGVDRQDKAQLSFLAYLRQAGYEVVSKNVIRRKNGSCKANLDVELAIDMLSKVKTFNTAILVSGDGDFSYAVKKIKHQGKRVEVYSFPVDTSKRLSKACDHYHNLHDIFSLIKRD